MHIYKLGVLHYTTFKEFGITWLTRVIHY